MRTIKIFLASSEELENDRMAFGNLVRRLDNIYERRGIRVELFEWEDYDAAYNGQRKQDEYNDQIKASDLFLALFHTQAGRFTVEEFDVATEEFRQKASPKVYVYCRDLQAGETESPELAEFKRRLFNEMGHYWCRYGNRDTMQLHFVMQLQLVESSRMDGLKVDETGVVTLDGATVAHMDQLPFAAGNESYRQMQTELLELPDKIEKARERVKKLPDDEDLRDDLQAKLNRYNQLKEDFEQLQQNLFSTAKVIASLQLQQVSAMLRRAIEAFEDGNLERANALLDEIAHEADRHMERLEQDRALVHQDIDAFMLQAKTVLADVSIPIADRIERVAAIYAKADDWAQRSAYDKEQYVDLLFAYADFMRDNARYQEAKQIYLRLITLSQQVFGPDHPDVATSYNNIGLVYSRQGDYAQALDYNRRALSIREQVFGPDHPDVAISYGNIGSVYSDQGDYAQALDYYRRALSIDEQVFGPDDSAVSTSYNNIGLVYSRQGDYAQALDYYDRALSIDEQVFGPDHPAVATSCNNIGLVYFRQGDYAQALDYYRRALSIREQVFGPDHPAVATSYNNIGGVYSDQGDYAQALDYYRRALSISEQVFGPDHPDVATSCNNIGAVYDDQGDYAQALDYYRRALSIREQVFGPDHPDVARSYNNIGGVYDSQGDYAQALEYYRRVLTIREQVLDPAHPDVATSYNNIGRVYDRQGDYSQALDCYRRALSIREQVFGSDHPDVASSYYNIWVIYFNQGDYVRALEFLNRALSIREHVFGPYHPDVATCYNNIGGVYMDQGDYTKALEYFNRALSIREHVFGANQPDVANDCNCIGFAYYKQGNYSQALDYYSRALSIWEQAYGPDYPNTITVHRNIEQVKEAMRQDVESETAKDGFWSRLFRKKK